MIIPEFRNSAFRKICYRLNRVLNNPFFKFFLFPIFFIATISFLLTVLSKVELINQLRGLIGNQIVDFLLKWNIVFVALIFLFRECITTLKNIIIHYSKPDVELTRDELVAILDSIDQVVSSKVDRFLKKTKRALKDNWKATRIFKEVLRC